MPHSSRNIAWKLEQNIWLGQEHKTKSYKYLYVKMKISWRILKFALFMQKYGVLFASFFLIFIVKTEYSTRHRIQFGKGHDTKTILLVCLCVDGSFWSALMFATALPEVWFCICAIILGIFWQNLILNHTTYSVRARIWHKKTHLKGVTIWKKEKKISEKFRCFLGLFLQILFVFAT